MSAIQTDNVYALFNDALTFFESHPEKWCKDALARGYPGKKSNKGKFQAPAHPRARSWSLAGYLILRNGFHGFCYDEAIEILAANIKGHYWIAYNEIIPLSPFSTVCWLNDEMGYRAVINLLKRMVAMHANIN